MGPIEQLIILNICNCGFRGGDIHAYLRVNDGERVGPFFNGLSALTALLENVATQVDYFDQTMAERVVASAKDVLRVLPLTLERGAGSADYEEARDKLQKQFPSLQVIIGEIFSEMVSRHSEAETLVAEHRRQEAATAEAIKLRAAEYRDAVV